jgi:D-sedoheptulose 7-phosphate isomerase
MPLTFSSHSARVSDRSRFRNAVFLLGYDGGEIVRRELVDVTLIVRSDPVPRIQEAQAWVYHVLREILEEVYREP